MAPNGFYPVDIDAELVPPGSICVYLGHKKAGLGTDVDLLVQGKVVTARWLNSIERIIREYGSDSRGKYFYPMQSDG